MRVLQQQQCVGDAIGLPFLDQRALQLQRVTVGHEAETTDVKNASHGSATKRTKKTLATKNTKNNPAEPNPSSCPS
jgi:hypothetical protein